jgi:cell division protein ZapA (FtsZ GTPase activity inhibitor)
MNTNEDKLNIIIKSIKEKIINIVNESTRKYKYKNYSFNISINEIECFFALNLTEELNKLSNKMDIIEAITINIIVAVKYILNFLSKNNKIDLLDENELNEILYNLIFDVIDDSHELFALIT